MEALKDVGESLTLLFVILMGMAGLGLFLTRYRNSKAKTEPIKLDPPKPFEELAMLGTSVQIERDMYSSATDGKSHSDAGSPGLLPLTLLADGSIDVALIKKKPKPKKKAKKKPRKKK